MFYDKDKIKESLTLDDTFRIIENLGGKPEYSSFGFISETICHNHQGEGSRKLYYYSNNKLFFCYTECGSMDILEVIRRNKSLEDGEYTLYLSMQYVASMFDYNFEVENQEKSLVKNDLQILKNYTVISKKTEKTKLEYNLYNDKILNNLGFIPPQPWLNEGITIDTMKRYKIRYYGTDHKIVIPHFNMNNELIGIRGRALSKEDENLYGKYMPIKINKTMYTHPLSTNLYGLNLNLNNIKKIRKIIIFEAEKSVLLYDSMFGEENNISVAVCGSSISIVQQDIIKNICCVDEVILAFDKEFQNIGDKEFNKNKEFLLGLASKFKNYSNVSIVFDKFDMIGYKDSPIDKGKETFEFLLNNRILI